MRYSLCWDLSSADWYLAAEFSKKYIGTAFNGQVAFLGAWSLNMRPIGFSETSAANYRSTLRDIAKISICIKVVHIVI
jgi:hypothetical protein